MDKVSWSKTMAAEIIKAGYRALTKKYHPDAGGSHDEMVVLKVTTDHLEKLLTGSPIRDIFEQAAYQQGQRTGWHRPKPPPPPPPPRPPRSEFRDKIPVEPFNEYGWYCVKDSIVVRATEKAVQVKFPRNPLPQWVPKSQLHKAYNELWEEDDKGTLVFSKWIATQKGWL